MSFQQGLSGLNAAAKSLEVIGNNVSNANTVGFKQSVFSDVYTSLTSSNGSQIAQAQQVFSQGNITNTNNPLDIAINGGGFFRMSDNGEISYSRNGQFHLDKTGYIVNSDNKRLTGYTADAQGVLATGELNINTADLAPSATAKVTVALNLDARNTALPAAAFNASDPTSYHHSTFINVFDSLGNSHVLQSYFVKTAPGAWDLFTAVDGISNGYTPPAAPVATAQITFNASGVSPISIPALPMITAPVTTGAAALAFTLDYANNTQFGSAFSVNSLAQDGLSSGRLAGLSIGEDGTILGRYNNDQSATLGQIVLSNFTNPHGLKSLGSSTWAETAASGPPLTGAPNSGSLGALQSLAVEDSNVDLTAELVNMITAQRAYQASAQIIKTQDQAMQTLVNLR